MHNGHVYKTLLTVIAFELLAIATVQAQERRRLRSSRPAISRYGNSSVSTFSNVGDKPTAGEVRYKEWRARKKEYEREAEINRQLLSGQINAELSQALMQDWPKCIAMTSSGSICREPCSSRVSLYCSRHAEYVKLVELFLEAVKDSGSVELNGDGVSVLSSFLYVDRNKGTSVYELDEDSRFVVVQVVRLGEEFAVSDANGNVVLIAVSANYVDGSRVWGGRYISDGIKQYGIPGAMRTVPSLRSLTSYEERLLADKRKREAQQRAEAVYARLQKNLVQAREKLHRMVDDLLANDVASTNKVDVGQNLHDAVEGCYVAVAKSDMPAVKESGMRLRKAWDAEVAAQSANAAELKRKEVEARLKWEKEHPEEVERIAKETESRRRAEIEQQVAITREKMKTLESLIARYMKECSGSGKAPTSLVNIGYLKSTGVIPKKDAWGRPFDYEADADLYAIRSLGPDGQRDTQDDIIVTNQKPPEDEASSEQPSEKKDGASMRIRNMIEEIKAIRGTGRSDGSATNICEDSQGQQPIKVDGGTSRGNVPVME